jgi:chaperonin GroEL
LRKGVNLAVETIVEQLNKMSIPVKTRKQIEEVATISANGDRNIGSLLA